MTKRIVSSIALSVILIIAFVVLGPIIFWFVLPIALPLYVLIFTSPKRERRPNPATPSFPGTREPTPRRWPRLGSGSWKDMKRHIRDAIEFSIELLTWVRFLLILIAIITALAFIFFVPYGPFILSIGLFLGVGLIQFARRDSTRGLRHD